MTQLVSQSESSENPTHPESPQGDMQDEELTADGGGMAETGQGGSVLRPGPPATLGPYGRSCSLGGADAPDGETGK